MVLPFDELNNLQEKYSLPFLEEVDEATVEDDIEDLLIISFVYGVNNVNEWLGTNISFDSNEVLDVVAKPVAGKTFIRRIEDYFEHSYISDNGTVVTQSGNVVEPITDVIKRIAESETTRVFNEAMQKTAEAAQIGEGRQAVKTWHTMQDEKVRDTHFFLDGTTIPASDRFWTIDDDSATEPGGFTLAQNNVNCRCWLQYGWQ